MEVHVMMQRHRVQVRVDAAAGEQRRQRRREAHRPRQLREVERLDAEPVAHQRQPAGVALGHGEREHAVEALHAVRPPGVEGLEHHLRVAVAEEAIALGRSASRAAACSCRCSR
jgi:hypothetical protein